MESSNSLVYLLIDGASCNKSITVLVLFAIMPCRILANSPLGFLVAVVSVLVEEAFLAIGSD